MSGVVELITNGTNLCLFMFLLTEVEEDFENV